MVDLMVWLVRADPTIYAREVAACVNHEFQQELGGHRLHPNTVLYHLHKFGFQKKKVWVVRLATPPPPPLPWTARVGDRSTRGRRTRSSAAGSGCTYTSSTSAWTSSCSWTRRTWTAAPPSAAGAGASSACLSALAPGTPAGGLVATSQ